MKRIIAIIAIVSALLFSCVKQPEEAVVEPQPLPFAVSDTLMQIDSLMQSDADSALMMLLSAQQDVGTRHATSLQTDFDKNYQSLLISEALYKTDNPQLNRFRNETFQETSLQDAVHYFDSLAAQYPHNDDLTVFSARSHYMNGVGFYENDSVVEACQEYLHTLKIMEEHFDVKKLTGYKAKFMGLTYNRLKDLFSDQFMIEPAIYCGKKSLFYGKIAPTSKYGVAKNLNRLGLYYDMLGEKDSAYIYYKNALKVLPDSNNVVFRDIITHLTILSYYNLDVNSEESIRLLKEVAGQTCNDDEKLSRFLGVGCIYYNEKQYDSAIVYLKNVFENRGDAVSKFQSAEYLYNIYQMLGDTLALSKYSSYLSAIAAEKYDNMMMVSKLDKLFNDYLKQHKNKTYYDYNRHKIILVVSVSFSVIVFIFVTILIRNKKKAKNADIKYGKEKAKVGKLKKELIQKRSESEQRMEAFLKEPVCRKINNMICDIPVSARSNYSDYPNIKLNEKTIISLGEAVTKHFPNLKTALISSDINMKKDDLLLCYLYLIGLTNSQIALLRQCNFSTVFRQTERLKKSFKGCKNLPSFIKKIAVS